MAMVPNFPGTVKDPLNGWPDAGGFHMPFGARAAAVDWGVQNMSQGIQANHDVAGNLWFQRRRHRPNETLLVPHDSGNWDPLGYF